MWVRVLGIGLLLAACAASEHGSTTEKHLPAGWRKQPNLCRYGQDTCATILRKGYVYRHGAIVRNDLRWRVLDQKYAQISRSFPQLKGETDGVYFDRLLQETFVADWNDLTLNAYVDRYLLRDRGVDHRRRRFGVFRLIRKNDGRLSLIDTHTNIYRQGEENRLFGGEAREFKPLHGDFAKNPILHEIIMQTFRALPTPNDARRWRVGVHQIRVQKRATDRRNANPTPEGVHQDGHDLISIHFIRSANVAPGGGESLIYPLRKSETFDPKLPTGFLERRSLSRLLASYYIDDERVFHGVTPIHYAADPALEGTPNGRIAFRDMLLLDFDVEETSHACAPN